MTGDADHNAGDHQKLEEAIENSEPLIQASRNLVDSSVAAAARESGRTPEEQWERMGDHFEYMATEQDPHQRQIDDYAISGDTVEVER